MNSFNGGRQLVVQAVQECFTDDGIRHLELSLGRSMGDSERPMETTFFQSPYKGNIQHALSHHVTKNHFGLLGLLRDKCSLCLIIIRDRLDRSSTLTALVDSDLRYDLPQGAEDTRRCITRTMENWVLNDDNSVSPNSLSRLFWLYGGVGVGKSFLAQSLAEKFKINRELAASFFFFRGDSRRNDGSTLIPTLAYQLIQTFQGPQRLARIVEAKIRDNPDLFQKNRRTQMQELIIEPLIRLSMEEANSERPDPGLKHPRLIVIDGLDECLDADIQCNLLRIITDASVRLPYPLRFLIASRPESHIERIFKHDLSDTPRYNLSNDLDADEDIQIVMERQFENIRNTHPIGPHLPPLWPGEAAISSIVKQSSSHFIYASTVIRFIQSPDHRPDDRLRVILGLQQPHENDRPYDPLDTLYRLIFSEVEDGIEQIHCAFGIIHLRSLKIGLFGWERWTCDRSIIEELLGLQPGDLILRFRRLLSLVAFEEGGIRVYHKTLFDYLLDADRSGDNVLNLSLVHECAVNFFLRPENDMSNSPIELRHFVYHCQFANLNDDTIRYLQFLASDTNILDLQLLVMEEFQLIFYCLQVLSRPDFDSTGRWYKTFVENQIKNFFSPVSWAGWLRSIRFRFWYSAKCAEAVRSSFELFRDFNLSGSLCDRVNGCYRRTAVPALNVFRLIEREHEMFSLLLKKHHPEPEIGFSVMQTSNGHCLTHSCHFITEPDLSDIWVTLVVIVSYTKDGVRLSCSEFNIPGRVEFLEIMRRISRQHFENTQKAVRGDSTEVISTILDGN